jgi:hypothetical protein
MVASFADEMAAMLRQVKQQVAPLQAFTVLGVIEMRGEA